MSHARRKWPSIDILKLYAGAFVESEPQDLGYQKGNAIYNAHAQDSAFKAHAKWNEWLTKCLDKNDLEDLMKVRYGLQAGMDDLVKKKMSNDKINNMFIRWCKSIENTARKIIRKRIPLPNDNPNDTEFHAKSLSAKRNRDAELEKFFRRSAF